MQRSLVTLVCGALISVVSLSCNGTTGDQLLTFSAYASGVRGAAEPFKAGNFTIQLTTATMHVGAVYFNEAPPGASGFDGPVCVASAVFAAQVPGPIDVDLLSTSPQEFSVYGNGTADRALSWQVWFIDDNLNEDNVDGISFTPSVQIEGTATDADGTSVSFGAIVTINAVNRQHGSSDPTQPGLMPLCTSRIVQIPTDIIFFQGGTLRVTVDPRIWFTQQDQPIDFSPGHLPPVTDPNCINTDSAVPLTPQSFALAPETPPPATQVCGGSGQPCCAAETGGTAEPTCLDALSCTNDVCGPTYCIPNSSYLSGADPGANAGFDVFSEIISAAPFSATYVQPQP